MQQAKGDTMEYVIKINGVEWNILNVATWTVERNGTTARLFWKKGVQAGKLVFRDITNGRFISKKFVA